MEDKTRQENMKRWLDSLPKMTICSRRDHQLNRWTTIRIHKNKKSKRRRRRRSHTVLAIRTRTWPLRCPTQRAIICLHNYIKRSARSFFWDQLLNPKHSAAAHGAHLNINVLFFTYNVSHIHTVNTTHNKSVRFFLVRTKDQLQSLL